ncbi:MAG: 16S rRNA (guanine(527)-N(7))-methyltransferase RsmG [Spirochaetales bacterium]|nr:16S rRNA (guanine(527)-N(7))-methyltransferase RsmG [Spirochaetales bacterium]
MDDSFLRAALSEMGVGPAEALIPKIHRYVSEIVLFNPSLKLVGDEGDALYIRHVLDSMSAAALIRREFGESFHAADLGSGAGLPGIPLALALEGGSFDLVERMGRRCGFLRNAVAALGLSSRVRVIQGDISAISASYDFVTMRAVSPLVRIAGPAGALVRPGGAVLAYKGTSQQVDCEVAELQARYPGRYAVESVAVSVPGLDGERHICQVRPLV